MKRFLVYEESSGRVVMKIYEVSIMWLWVDIMWLYYFYSMDRWLEGYISEMKSVGLRPAGINMDGRETLESRLPSRDNVVWMCGTIGVYMLYMLYMFHFWCCACGVVYMLGMRCCVPIVLYACYMCDAMYIWCRILIMCVVLCTCGIVHTWYSGVVYIWHCVHIVQVALCTCDFVHMLCRWL